MKIQSDQYDLLAFLDVMVKNTGRKVAQDCQEYKLIVPSQQDAFQLYVYDFEDGIQGLLLSGLISNDWEWTIGAEDPSPLLMYFNAQGKVKFIFQELEDALSLEAPGAFFTAHPGGVRQQMLLQAGTHSLLLALHLKRQLYLDHIHCLPDEVKQVFASVLSGKSVVKPVPQTQPHSHRCLAVLHEILMDDKSGLTRSTFVKLKILEMFSCQLEQWEAALKAETTRYIEGIELLEKAKNILLNDLKNAPTIQALSRKVGLNQQKLKRGFKLAYGKTINEFLREERLKLARKLLSEGKPTVRQVASEVGYDNASYFARRFHERYGIYPVEYLKMIKNSKTLDR
jgi:AraC family transcriptional regulator, transcriptional activator of the genes for pyochelin and ferripyochelin receptors